MPFLLLLFSLWLAQAAPADTSRELKLRLVEEINRDRQAAGLQPVEYSEELSRAADAHCREMLREGYASHWNLAGLKPYMRYAAAGIGDFTSENVWSLWRSNLDTAPASVWKEVLAGHRSFMAERPPYDGHRRSILTARHTRVGIGLAFDRFGVRLIEVFGARNAELKPLPARATLADKLRIEGRIADRNLKLFGVAIYYEPLPQPMYRQDLAQTQSYGLPEEHEMELPRLGNGMYSNGSAGSIDTDPAGEFSMPLRFWKKLPGVYTIGVWVQEKSAKEALLGAMTSVVVEDYKPNSR
ncbi:MAG: CAP domain-containing protein [Acidobacteria bacterium]|nr:CAP domain-containing protein [Acidobacteriota bacterium]MCL5288442.1 CAP domain-containing protein [Acidobacteriota bacterium]